MPTSTRRRSFAQKLRAHLNEHGIGVRTLARTIDPDNVEPVRRSLNKWLSGQHLPSAPSRQLVTAALGLEQGSLDSDDDEEADPLTDALIDALMERLLRRLARQQTTERTP